ncbi:MAG TPA: bifunctional glutamate N-acetyltransferase/amino-acid acetyltransferase ArgJ [Candidatus Limnocylindria bacterium]|nr:bifunctional glutamate N-acetyltransferase/amino-acid acetyltransferase ArgJ [Candidatus Limnocylindria bacterium]
MTKGVTTPLGFLVGAGEAGLRDHGGDDLVLLVAEEATASAAATLTTNRFRAAPVLLAEQALAASGGQVKAVIVNAGCANAGTGPEGLQDARSVVAAVAERLGCQPDEVIPASTGLIGSRLKVEAIVAALGRIKLGRNGQRAAHAILTTDTVAKQAEAYVPTSHGRIVRLGGMAKGSGMIHPQMATMLAFVTTDAPVPADHLRSFLKAAVDATFNQITVDGDTSTNDMVLALASGAAGGEPITPGTPDGDRFADALSELCRTLAVQIAADGEGAEHLIEVMVTGAASLADARAAARTVASSSLLKAAVHGEDPNWGRIAAAAGRSGAELDPNRLRISIGPVVVFAGSPCPFDQVAARRQLKKRNVQLTLDLGIGEATAQAWGCDLTAEYVAINSEYPT